MRSLLVITLFLFAPWIAAQTGSQSASIDQQQHRLDRLEKTFLASQSRLIDGQAMMPSQQVTFNQLQSVNNLLAATNRELTVLTTLQTLAEMIREPSLSQAASRIVLRQQNYIAKQADRHAKFVVSILHIAKDQATSGLLLEARDALVAVSGMFNTNRSTRTSSSTNQ